MNVKIGTYNIAHGRGTAKSNWDGGSLQERQRRLEEIAKVIKPLDIVVLNEVDFYAPWTWWLQNQAKILKELGGFSHLATAMNNRVIWHCGLAILSKFPIVSSEVISLPQYYAKTWTLLGYRKDALAATIQLSDGKQIQVIGVHLDHHHDSKARRPSAEIILKHAAAQTIPVIVAGDHNTQPAGFPGDRDEAPTAVDLLRSSGLFQTTNIVAPTEDQMTFHSQSPWLTIDWIFAPKSWQMLSYKVLPVTLSDHRPVVAELELK